MARNQLLVLWSRLGRGDRGPGRRRLGLHRLAGERLTGRVATRADRKSGVFVVEGMYAEPGAAPDPALPAALELLASFAGVASVSYAGPTAFGVS